MSPYVYTIYCIITSYNYNGEFKNVHSSLSQLISSLQISTPAQYTLKQLALTISVTGKSLYKCMRSNKNHPEKRFAQDKNYVNVNYNFHCQHYWWVSIAKLRYKKETLN